MILFPAIDLVGGQVVRLAKGDRAHMDVYSNDPVAVAEAFRDAGATWIHVVDLSATLEEDETARAANSAAIQSICAVSGISVDAGGGVRSMEAIERLVSLGVKRIAIGTALVRDPAFAEAAAREFGELVVADVAARGGEVRVNGWREGAALSADELVKQLASLGFRHLVLPMWRAMACDAVSIRKPTSILLRWQVFRWWHLVALRAWKIFVRLRRWGQRLSRVQFAGERFMRASLCWKML